jgi:hypothetical protein
MELEEIVCKYMNWIHLAQDTDRSRDSSVGIALGYGLDDRGSRVRFPAGNFSLHHLVQTSSGAHISSYPMGNRGTFPEVKRPGREADHSPPSSAEVKECVELYLHSPIRLHGVMLSKSQGQLYLLPQDRDQRRALVNTVMNLRLPLKARNFLRS